MKQEINQPYMQCYVQMSQYFTERASFFISSAGKIENVQEFKVKLFE